MQTAFKFFIGAVLVIMNVFALQADDGRYQKYQELLKLNNDTVKCKQLIIYAITVADSLHDYDFALLIYGKVNSILKNKEYPFHHIKLYYNWGYTYYQRGNYEDADRLYLLALADRTLDKNPDLKARILNMAAVNLQHMLVSKRALNYYNEALEIYTRLNDLKNKGAVYMNMANVYIMAGDFVQAEALLNKAINIYLQNNMMEDYGIMLANKGYIKSKAGQADSAKILLIRALNLPLKIQLKKAGAYVKMYANLGTYYSTLKNWDSCFYCLNRGKRISDSMGLSNQFDGTYYNFMGCCYDEKNDLAQAVHYYKLALKVKTGIAGYKLLYGNIANIYFKNKQYDSAFFYKNEAIRVADSTYKSELKELVTFENKRIELLEKDYRDQDAMQQLAKKNYVLLSVILFLTICALVFFIYFRRYRLRIKKEHLQSELDFLKAQLNPHFLFNSINNIYVLLDENKEKASEILLKFSELMRYQLYECNVMAISLSKELQFLGNYIEFENLRYSNKISVSYNINQVDAGGLVIAPLLLQPFIENAFKHTPKKKEQQSRVQVHTTLRGTEFLFEVTNTVDASQTASDLPGGIGLKNVKKRLKLLYPGRHDLKITKTDQQYTIVLKLTLAYD